MIDIDTRTIATARGLILDMVEERGQGHPGTALSLAPLFQELFARTLTFDPVDPTWFDRDRLVLSSGHAAAVLYAYLALAGHDLDVADLTRYRRFGSRTPGHPEVGRTPGVDATTGALGQGLGNAVGMALAESILRAEFGEELCDHRTYVVVGDGDLQEGISHEVLALAGHWGLDRLTCVYNSNDITLEGAASIAMSENVGERFAAYGWHVITLASGESTEEIAAALAAAALEVERPTVLIMPTRIATPSPGATGSHAAHGAPLGADETARTKVAMGLDPDARFQVDERVAESGRGWSADHRIRRSRWSRLVETSDEGRRLSAWLRREIDLPALTRRLAALLAGMPGEISPRDASQAILDVVLDVVPFLVVGSADISTGTGTVVRSLPRYTRARPTRHLAFGIREHGMAAIMTGLGYHGGVIPVGSTYLVFSDYLRPALRMACLASVPMLLVLTHDGFDGAEDGPTHHGVEHLAALRTLPGLEVLRPADAAETAGAWSRSLLTTRPTCLVLSREPVSRLTAHGIRGVDPAVVQTDEVVDLTLVATGVDVHVAVAVAALLRRAGRGCRVISAPGGGAISELSEGPVFLLETGTTSAWDERVAPTMPVTSLTESGSATQLRAAAGLDPVALAAKILGRLEDREILVDDGALA